MAQDRISSADILIANNAEVQLGPILQVTKSFPELLKFPAVKVEKTTFQSMVITADGQAAFRAVNGGRETVSPTLSNVTLTTKFLDGSWDVDQAAVDESDRPVASTLEMLQRSAWRGTFQVFCPQIWYGVGIDANGFAGIASLYPYTDSDNVVDAGGTGNTTSVFLVGYDPDEAFALAWGKNAQLRVGDVDEARIFKADGTFFFGYQQNLAGWCGVQLFDWERTVRICNLTPATPLTDDLIAEALTMFRVGKEPDDIWMTKEAREQLRNSRTATNPTGNPAPFPEDAFGVPIVPTPSLSNTETALVAAGT